MALYTIFANHVIGYVKYIRVIFARIHTFMHCICYQYQTIAYVFFPGIFLECGPIYREERA